MIVRELITRLGFNADEAAAKRYTGQVAGVAKAAVLAVGAIKSLAAGVYLLGRQTAMRGNDITKLGVEVGVTAEEFQALSFALSRVSRITQQEIERQLPQISARLAEAREKGSRYAKTLRELGFTQQEVQRGTISALDLLQRMNDQFRRTGDASEAARIATDLFGFRLGSKLGPALTRSDADLRGLMQRFHELGGGISNEGAQRAEEYADAMLDLQTAINSVRYEIGVELIPALIHGAERMRDWVVVNRELIRQNLQRVISTIVDWATRLRDVLFEVAKRTNEVVQSFGGWEAVLRTLGYAVLIGGLWRLLLVMVLIGAALVGAKGAAAALDVAMRGIPFVLAAVAIGALIDDIVQWVSGNKSLLGRLLGDWEEFRDKMVAIVEEIQNVFTSISDAIKPRVPRHIRFLQMLMNPMNIGTAVGEAMSNRGGGTSVGRNVQINVEANINVPEGTPEQTRSAFATIARRIFGEELDREIRDSLLDLEPETP